MSVLLIVLDSRYDSLSYLRDGLASLLRPVQAAVRVPVDLTAEIAGFLTRHREMQKENAALHAQHVLDAARLHRLVDVEAENVQLRSLLDARSKNKTQTVAAEIWTVSRDPFSRRVILDKGSEAGIAAGQSVVDALGLMGQVVRVYPYGSEVALVTDSDLTIPAYVQRTGQRVLVFGTGYGLEVRYQPSAADIQPGDVLLTSGIDRLYPEGLPIARISKVVRPSSNPYAKIYCLPIARVEGSRMLAVLTNPAKPEKKK